VKMIMALIYFLLFLLLYGCRKDSPTESSLKSDATIEEAIAFWDSKNITNYTLEQTTISWYPWSGDSVRINVIEDTVYSVTSVKTGINLNIDSVGWYKTVKQLFEIAERDTNVYDISYELSTKYGYPKILYYAIKPPPVTEGGIKIITYNFTRE
jgi:hypothetical protein